MAKKSKKTSQSIDLSRKKQKEFDVDTNIRVVFKTGKILFGKEQVLKQIRQKPFKMLIIAKNCPQELEDQLKYYNTFLKESVFIHRYKGSSWELGLAMGKPYMVSVIGINDYGDSALSSLKAKSN